MPPKSNTGKRSHHSLPGESSDPDNDPASNNNEDDDNQDEEMEFDTQQDEEEEEFDTQQQESSFRGSDDPVEHAARRQPARDRERQSRKRVKEPSEYMFDDNWNPYSLYNEWKHNFPMPKKIWKRSTGVAGAQTSEASYLAGDLRTIHYNLLRTNVDDFVQFWLQQNMGHAIFKGVDRDAQGSTVVRILSLMDPDVLEVVFISALPEKLADEAGRYDHLRKIINAQTQQALNAKLNGRIIHQPHIYAHFLINDITGKSPTWQQILTIIGYLREYQGDLEFAKQIDCAVRGPNGHDGTRFYFKGVRNPGKTLKIFADAFQANMKKFCVPGRENEPMPIPLSEWGYTHNGPVRKQDHEAHRSTNWLMGLTHAICEWKWPREFMMKYHVVFCIPYPDLCEQAEAVLTTIGQGYIENGAGFNYHPAGGSTGPSEITPEEAKLHFDWTYRHIDVKNHFAKLNQNLVNEVYEKRNIYSLRHGIGRDEEDVDRRFELAMSGVDPVRQEQETQVQAE